MEKIVKISACNKMNFSNNVNEVIRAVLNSFFHEKILHAPEAPKASEAQKRNEAKA